MKYIRTKDGIIFPTKAEEKDIDKSIYLKVADTIEELCDYFDYHNKILKHFLIENNPYITDLIKTKDTKFANKDEIKTGIYGAIWTDKGLIYVAKMNEKGELELL